MFRIKIRGVWLGVSFGFPAVIAVVLLAGGTDILKLMTVLLCSVMHECGHLAFMLFFDRTPEAVTLYCGGIRITPRQGRIDSFGRDMAILLAGCGVNFILAGLGLLFGGMTFFVRANFILGAFNLLPFRYFDGGRALEMLAGGRTARAVQSVFIILFAVLIIFMGANGSVSASMVITFLIIALDTINNT